MHTQDKVRIHRLGDEVAFDFHDTPTLYITKEMAHEFAAQLLTYASDCRNTKFSQSCLGTINVHSDGSVTDDYKVSKVDENRWANLAKLSNDDLDEILAIVQERLADD